MRTNLYLVKNEMQTHLPTGARKPRRSKWTQTCTRTRRRSAGTPCCFLCNKKKRVILNPKKRFKLSHLCTCTPRPPARWWRCCRTAGTPSGPPGCCKFRAGTPRTRTTPNPFSIRTFRTGTGWGSRSPLRSAWCHPADSSCRWGTGTPGSWPCLGTIK